MLRTFRSQRRGQDKYDEVVAQSAPPAARAGAAIRSRSGKARSRGEAPSLLRTRPGGILSVDECSRDAGLPRFLSSVLESEDGTGVARAFWARSGAAHGRSEERRVGKECRSGWSTA